MGWFCFFTACVDVSPCFRWLHVCLVRCWILEAWTILLMVVSGLCFLRNCVDSASKELAGGFITHHLGHLLP